MDTIYSLFINMFESSNVGTGIAKRAFVLLMVVLGGSAIGILLWFVTRIDGIGIFGYFIMSAITLVKYLLTGFNKVEKLKFDFYVALTLILALTLVSFYLLSLNFYYIKSSTA